MPMPPLHPSLHRRALNVASVAIMLLSGLVTTQLGTSPAGAATPIRPASVGYWLSASDGGIFTFGGAPFVGSAGGSHLAAPIVGMAGSPSGRGYWLVGADGRISNFGDAANQGSAPRTNSPVVGLATTPDGGGYWIVNRSGRVFAFGNAPSFATAQLFTSPTSPIVGIAATADGGGYWLVSAGGGVFSFGDAPFYGSAGALPLAKPIVGMAATGTGGGYWLVASDGGIFSYGDAAFHGSTGAIRLVKPIVGMAPSSTGGGYWLVASDGGIFAFGDAPFRGSTGARRLNQPIVAMAPSRAADPYPAGQQGNDISFPQCGGSLPSQPFAFGVVGVNNGRAFTHNPCLAAEARWAGPTLSVYVNLNAPTTDTGPGAGQGLSGPAGTCDPTRPACLAFNFGYNAAVDAFNYATDQGVTATVWWLDIETSNTWDPNPSYNASTIQGALSALTAEGAVAGIYSTGYQWGIIAGKFAPQTPIWVATGGDLETARQYCAPDHGFGGGTAWLTQFGTQGIPYDQDYACPVA